MTKRIFIGLSLILVFCGLVYAESENYCHDEKSWKEWDALIEKNPNDMEVQALHALRIGLCTKVDRGGITLDQATRTRSGKRTNRNFKSKQVTGANYKGGCFQSPR
jgi:hypothetical protein